MESLWEKKRNWIFIGEAGCGKTEAALFLAGRLREKSRCRVNLIDMDQTKGMFRARDFAQDMGTKGVEVKAGLHFMDMPIVPYGVERLLEDKSVINVLDVGGNENGAVTLGQFTRKVNDTEAAVLYLINPYRNFSGTTENIRMLMEGIQAAGRVETVYIIANPNLGQATTAQDVLEGCGKLEEILAPLEIQPKALMLPNWVDEMAFSHLPFPKWVITPYIKYP